MLSYILCHVSQFMNDITYHESTAITNKHIIMTKIKIKIIWNIMENRNV